MKKIIGLFVVLGMAVLPARAQFLKNVLNSVKNTVQNRANDKAASTTNKAIDKVDGTGKSGTTPAAGNTGTGGGTAAPGGGTAGSATGAGGTSGAGGAGGAAGTGGAGAGGGADQDPPSDKGFVRVDVSATKTVVGMTVKVTGFSPALNGMKTVVMTVTGPGNMPNQTFALRDSGSFSGLWVAAGQGHYRLTVKSQDGKAQKSVNVDVYPFEEMDQITGPVKEQGEKAIEKIKQAVSQAVPGLSAADAGKLNNQMSKMMQHWAKVEKLLDDLAQAGKGLDAIEKKYGPFSQPVTDGFTKLTETFEQEGRDLGQSNDQSGDNETIGSGKSSHQSYDNTICEYLVMINEACAAFSTFTNFEGNALKVITNLASDKAAPMGADAASKAAGASDATTMSNKEVAKVMVQAKLDAGSLASGEGVLGFAGDMVQMCGNYLLKTYCVVMDGNLDETYMCTYENSYHNVWWQYKYTTGATISLRYPKGASSGGVIKMKGNIEGNATKFSIYTDMNEQDDFKRESKGRSHVFSICVYAPPSMPFVPSQLDRKTGFGAVARTVVTPACFNIPIDVDYDVDAKTMKFYVNDALVDFGPTVQYIYCYLVIAAGIPLTTRVDLPINKVKLTLGKAISMNSTFPVVRDSDNNISVKGSGDSKIGQGTPIYHSIKFNFSATSAPN